MKIVILYSGGLDSLIMNHYAKINFPDSEVKLCYYDIGQEYNFKEIKALPDNVLIRKLDWLNDNVECVSKENTQNIMIPGRNLALATLVACQELPDKIWMGALQGEIHDEATDKNYSFLDHINKTLSYVLAPYGVEPKVEFPLADAGFGKFESVKWFIENSGSIEELLKSSSCLTKEHDDDCDNCGLCIVCLRRWGIFNQLGIEETYIHHPINEMNLANKKMIKEMLKGELGYDCHYDEYRRREIMPALYTFFGTKDIEKLLCL